MTNGVRIPKLILGDADSELAHERAMNAQAADELAQRLAPLLVQVLGEGNVKLSESYAIPTRSGHYFIAIPAKIDGVDVVISVSRFGRRT